MPKRLTILLSALILLVTLVPQAHANGVPVNPGTTLSYLIQHNGYIVQGDKRFSDFSFTVQTSNPGKTYCNTSGQIKVSGVTKDRNNGLSFVPIGYDNLFYASQGATLKIVIGYKVTVLDPTQVISDIHLVMGSTTKGDATITVTEKVYQDAAHMVLLGQAQVTNPPQSYDSDMVDLAHTVSMAFVTKEIMINGGTGCGDVHSHTYGGGWGCTSSGSISFIKQLVSQEHVPQEVPEPSTLLLLGSGLVGLFTRFRKGGAEGT